MDTSRQAVEHTGHITQQTASNSQDIFATAHQATDDPPGSVNMLVWAHREKTATTKH